MAKTLSTAAARHVIGAVSSAGRYVEVMVGATDMDLARSRGGKPTGGRKPRLRLLALTAAMALVTINIWTGAPLLALWLGSQVQAGGPPTLGAVTVVVVSLTLICLALVWLLGWLNEAHEQLTGQVRTVRDHAPWLRSMRDEKRRYTNQEHHLTALERILVIAAVLAFLALEVMFFLFPNSRIDPTYAALLPPV